LKLPGRGCARIREIFMEFVLSFPCGCLEERVAEDTVFFGRAVQCCDSAIPFIKGHQALLQDRGPDTFNHGCKRQFRETFHKGRA